MSIPRRPLSSIPDTGRPTVASPNNEVFWRIPTWFPDIDPTVLDKLKSYHSELIRFNNTVNLIGVKTIPTADLVHFADSILAARLIMQGVDSQPSPIDVIHDFGSGNGFPGLVLAILYPKLKVICVDTDQRKCEFLKHVVSHLKLSNVEVTTRAVEAFPENSVKYAVSRGFAPIPRAVLVTRKIIPLGGSYYHMKSEEWAAEIAAIPTQLCSFWSPALIGEYRLPVGEVKFAVVRTDRTGS